MRKKITAVLFTILFLFCCTKLFLNAGNILWWETAISLVNPQGFWTPQQINQARQAELLQDMPVTFTAWGQQDNVPVFGERLDRTVEAPVIWTDGPAALISPEGNRLDADDSQGCLVGEETALKLFGSTQVIGEQIAVEDRTFTVRGTVKAMPKAVIASCPDEDNSVLNRMNLQRPSDAGLSWSPDNFLLRTGISARQLDIALAADAQRLLTGTVPLLLLILSLSLLLGRLKRSRQKPLQLLDRLLLLLLAAAALVAWIRFFCFLPDTLKAYAPGQWSDLEYLSAFIKGKAEAITNLATLTKTQADLPLFTTLWSAFFYTLGALFAFFIGPYGLCRRICQTCSGSGSANPNLPQ